MRIGYACLTEGIEGTNFKSCTMKNATETNLIHLIEHNLTSLENIIDYNIENNIKHFRITSDLIPFGSSEVNTIPWWTEFSHTLLSIGEKIKSARMRVSMHPGQYTVLNSPNKDVVKRAINDLEYHTKVLDSLGVGHECKLILHIGGVYNDKQAAMKRFISNYQTLADHIKNRLVIENDDRLYNIEEVLSIGENLHIPVVFDNLHHEVLHSEAEHDFSYWLKRCRKTWGEKDGIQKIHYSQQDLEKRPGAHSPTINVELFQAYLHHIDEDTDIMLEVKDKNLSAIKCILATTTNKKIKNLEVEWGKYKYTVLESAPSNYHQIRQLLKDKEGYPVVEFYRFIDDALEKEEVKGNVINTALHVWGYFKDIATESEKEKFMKSVKRYEENKTTKKRLKNILWQLAKKYERDYLLNSYYFHL